MCDPVSILTLGASVISAYGQKKSADYNADVMRENAKVEDMKGRDALNRGNQDQIEQANKTRQMLARQTVTMAANNVDLQTGTPLDILGDTALFGAVDEGRVRANAAREAYGHFQGAKDLRNQAQMTKWQGRMGAFTTVLGGVADSYGGFKKALTAKPAKVNDWKGPR